MTYTFKGVMSFPSTWDRSVSNIGSAGCETTSSGATQRGRAVRATDGQMNLIASAMEASLDMSIK